MSYLGSSKFNAQKMCGNLCLQHNVNEVLDKYIKKEINIITPSGTEPEHLDFV